MSDGVTSFRNLQDKEAASQSGSANATETGSSPEPTGSAIQVSVAFDGSRVYTCEGHTLNPHTQHLYKEASELYWGPLASYMSNVRELSMWSPSFRGQNHEVRKSNQSALAEAHVLRERFPRVFHKPLAGSLMPKEEALTEAATWTAEVKTLIGNREPTSDGKSASSIARGPAPK